jgi:nucleoside-diphosphate-sugar epimerase
VGGWLTRAAAGAPGIPTLSLDREVDLLDVRDAVEGFCVLIERGAAGGVYNLASGTTLSMRTLFATLCPGATPVEAATRPEPARLVGEAPALRALGWVPRVPLAETLAAVTVHRRERRR